MTYQPDPGTTLAAVETLNGGQDSYTREQVAYLIHLAFLTGLGHRHAMDTAEDAARWEAGTTPQATAAQRKADRLAAYERISGPARYQGGPVDWETGRPVRHLEVAA